jgi:hypothetical protein
LRHIISVFVRPPTSCYAIPHVTLPFLLPQVASDYSTSYAFFSSPRFIFMPHLSQLYPSHITFYWNASPSVTQFPLSFLIYHDSQMHLF